MTTTKPGGKICTHFGTCGGCNYLDIDYTKELRKKEQNIKELFKTYRHLEFRTIVPSPSPEFYRHKIQLPFGRRIIGNKTLLTLGLFNKESTFVLDQTECDIQDPGLTEIALAVKQWARREGLLPYNEKSKRGMMKYLVARKSFSTGEIILGIVTAKEDLPHPKDASKRLHTAIQNRIGKTGKLGKIVGIIHNINTRHTTMALGREEHLLWGRPYIHEHFGKHKFRVGLSTFLQVNPIQTPSLYNLVLDEIEPESRVIDAYSGIGTISFWISGNCKEVMGIEENPASHRTALESIKYNHVHNVRFRKGRVAEVLPSLFGKNYDTLVLDPPRTGLGAEVAETILGMGFKKIVYVSCDPLSLREDTNLLARQYFLNSVQPVDMFPRTDHVETVAVFRNKNLT